MSDRNALREELKALNEAVKVALSARKAWMDAHMADFANYPIGTELYARYPERGGFFSDGYMGKVTSYYRYHADDPRFDTSMEVDYRTDRGANSSSRSGMVESREERAQRLKYEAERLSHPKASGDLQWLP